MLYLDTIFETNLYLLSFSWQRSFLKLMVKSYSWILLFPTVIVRSPHQIFFHEIACNDSQTKEKRSCISEPGSYVATTIGCVILSVVIGFIAVFNNIYLIKDWIDKYDHLSMNAPQFMFMLEIYFFVRAVSDALPYDQFNIYVYYVRCLLLALYTGYMLLFALLKVAFQSAHVQQ